MIAIPDRLALKLVIGVVAALMLALLVHDRNRWKSTAALRQQQLVVEKHAHARTVANYRAAAEEARRKDSENVARVKAEQAAINERTAHDYESRIAAARARAGELQRETRPAGADPRGGRAAHVSGLPSSAGGTSEAAREDELSGSDRLIATEQAIQLDELIKWVERQSEVPAN